MNINGFIWLEDIAEKLWSKHNVSQDEAEEVFRNAPYFRFVENGHRADENVYAALGQTEAGRNLIVFFVLKISREALIISARDMTPGERRHYERR